MIPNIPSDNLYKTMTFSGAVLAIVCLVGPMVLQAQFNSTQVAYLKDVNASNVSLYIAMPPKTDKSESDVARREELLKLVDQNHESHQNWLNEAVSMKNKVDEAASPFLWVGCVLFLVGLALWWMKVQFYQDEILKAEYAKIKK
jgi:hypothetical protein